MRQQVSDAASVPRAPVALKQLGPQAVTGAVTTAGFFLCEGLLGQHFNMVPNGVAEPQPGDLFLFPLASGGPGWWGAHAGIYCGDEEIIHLEGEPQEVAWYGDISMEGTWGIDRVPFALQAAQGCHHQA